MAESILFTFFRLKISFDPTKFNIKGETYMRDWPFEKVVDY
ncbi:hypothetical protein BH18THE1_BH18THE1_12370 [soil metagenome]